MKVNLLAIWLITILLSLACACYSLEPTTPIPSSPKLASSLKLPDPRLGSTVSVEEALLKRRSIREYADLALTLGDVSQLLWAAQGITAEGGGRTAPSAGALYPLEVYLVAGNVENLAAGVYRYKPEGHELIKVKDYDVRKELAAAALGQDCIREGAIDIVIAAVYERTIRKYGDRGVIYAHMEAGHAAQNICLQAAALNLGGVTVGAFYDDQVKDIVGMPENESPLYVIPLGHIKT